MAQNINPWKNWIKGASDEEEYEPPALPQDSIAAAFRAFTPEAKRKPLGYRADREPDASWHRPTYHRPGIYGREEETEPVSEAERKERCERHRNFYEFVANDFFNNKMTLEQANKQIKELNTYFVPKGCPALPEFGAPMLSKR
jgi:hypothetical protein